MIPRITLVATLATVATATIAQTDVIAQRRSLMKENGAAARTSTQMLKGEIPFDLARAREVFAGIQTRMTQFPTLFPENSKTGGDTKAAPRIWEDRAGFETAAAKIVQDAAAAAGSTTDQASFQTNFQKIGADCTGCHRTYRINPQQ